ncbi:MAG: porin [Betaproteobacteria bacterium]|nr:porin [Betaproteobacteria bacterium]
MRAARLAIAMLLPVFITGTLPPANAEEAESVETLRKRVESLEDALRRIESLLLRDRATTTAGKGEGAALEVAGQPEAQAAGSRPPIEEKLEQLDQSVRVLARKQEIEQEAAAARGKEAVQVTADRNGFSLRSADGAFRFRIGGVVQADARAFLENEITAGATDNFLLRRVRPVFEGTFAEKYGFLIRPEFGNQGALSLLDGYVEARFTPHFRLRGGKFKAPAGLERLQSPSDIAFIERAFPTQLLPNRDIGFQISGDVLDNRLGYALGWFNGVRDNASADSDTNSAKDFAARVFAHPFRKSESTLVQGFGVGIAVTSGDQPGSPASSGLPTYLSPGQQTFFSYAAGAFASGDRHRWSPQLYHYAGPFGFMAEYAAVSQKVTRAGAQQTVDNRAWQIYATWVLTGEDATYQRVTPRQSFDPEKGGWGAFEVGLRVSRLDVDDDVFAGAAGTRLADPGTSARSATDVGFALNWYLNRNIKIQTSYDHTRFDGGAAGSRDAPDEKVLVTRLQAAF